MPLFESPVGMLSDRNKGVGRTWPSGWYDATPFGEPYEMKTGTGKTAIHTGADLNLDADRDAHEPVYAMGDGTIVFANLFSDIAWGNLVIIDHDVVDGKVLFSRYAHVERISMTLKPGAIVHKGDEIARVGNGGAVLKFPYHLHFDISTTAILKREHGFWPGMDKKGVLDNFVDPLKWLQATHFLGKVPPTSPQSEVSTPIPSDCEALFAIHDGVQIHKDHSLSAEVVQVLNMGAKLILKKEGRGNLDGLTWAQVAEGEHAGCWVAVAKAGNGEAFLSAQPHN